MSCHARSRSDSVEGTYRRRSCRLDALRWSHSGAGGRGARDRSAPDPKGPGRAEQGQEKTEVNDPLELSGTDPWLVSIGRKTKIWGFSATVACKNGSSRPWRTSHL